MFGGIRFFFEQCKKLEAYFSPRLSAREVDPVAAIITNEKEIFGRFNWIDALVRRYPCYTHDDIFYLEYDFAMTLLQIIKMEIDFAREYDKAKAKTQRHGRKNR